MPVVPRTLPHRHQGLDTVRRLVEPLLCGLPIGSVPVVEQPHLLELHAVQSVVHLRRRHQGLLILLRLVEPLLYGLPCWSVSRKCRSKQLYRLSCWSVFLEPLERMYSLWCWSVFLGRRQILFTMWCWQVFR